MLEEDRALLGYYTETGVRFLLRFGSIFRIHPQWSRILKKTFLILEDGNDIFPETSIRNYQF